MVAAAATLFIDCCRTALADLRAGLLGISAGVASVSRPSSARLRASAGRGLAREGEAISEPQSGSPLQASFSYLHGRKGSEETR